MLPTDRGCIALRFIGGEAAGGAGSRRSDLTPRDAHGAEALGAVTGRHGEKANNRRGVNFSRMRCSRLRGYSCEAYMDM
jgi:hypothetical protein